MLSIACRKHLNPMLTYSEYNLGIKYFNPSSQRAFSPLCLVASGSDSVILNCTFFCLFTLAHCLRYIETTLTFVHSLHRTLLHFIIYYNLFNLTYNLLLFIYCTFLLIYLYLRWWELHSFCCNNQISPQEL